MIFSAKDFWVTDAILQTVTSVPTFLSLVRTATTGRVLFWVKYFIWNLGTKGGYEKLAAQ